MTNNKNGLAQLNQFRIRMSNMRAEVNAMIGTVLDWIDEAELRLQKEGMTEPTVRVEDGEVIELDLKGRPEKRS